jgi:NADH-quinone oxidoreductase subunit G
MNDSPTTSSELITLTINGNTVSVPKGTTVYKAAVQLGIDVPIFCYHDRMPPFGACRMCLVSVEKMPKLQTSCTLQATEGMVVNTASPDAVKGREEILEFLLLNHPLDCPICDRGGECPLQDQTLKHGPGQSRFFEEKRRFKKPLPLGPVLTLDRERCIQCARCTRFGAIVAGDNALEFKDRGYRMEVGTPDGGPAESKFIGNTIMIGPVGALTSQVYRFRARPWDNTPTETTCTLCPVGCSMILDARDGEIMRTRSCENRSVNDIWMCDKGWFGYEFSAREERLSTPLIRRDGRLTAATWEEALTFIANRLTEAKASGKIAAWGGDPLTVEESYLFQKLMREGAGAAHVDHRIGGAIYSLEEEGIAPGMEMSIGECEELSWAIICGADLTEEFPVIWLRLHQAINNGARILFTGHFSPEIANYFTTTDIHTPGKELQTLQKHLPQLQQWSSEGRKGAIFVGRQYLQNPARLAVLSELLQWQQQLPNTSLNILEGRGNSMGARLAGMHPELGPMYNKLPEPGLNALQVVQEAASNGWEVLYVAGANPAMQLPSATWDAARKKVGCLIVQDIFLTATAQQADVVLPTLAFVEKEGHCINIEGRIQKLLPGKHIPEGIYSDAEIFMQLAQKLNLNLSFDAIFAETLLTNRETQGRLPCIRPNKLNSHTVSNRDERQPGRDTFYASFAPALFDQGVRMKHSLHVIQLAKPPFVRIHPEEGQRRSISDGGQVRITANGSTIDAKVQWDKHVAADTAVLPLGFETLACQELDLQLINGIPIHVEASYII